MKDSNLSKLLADGGSTASDAAAQSSPDGASSSLVDLIARFDLSAHLSGPMRDAWEFLQRFPLLMVVVLVAVGYGVGWALKRATHVVLDRLRASEKFERDYEIMHYLTSPVLQTTVTLALVLAVVTLNLPTAIQRLLIKICFVALLLFWGRAWFRATKVILQALEAQRHRFHLFQPRTVPLFEMGIKLLLLGLFCYFFFLIWGIDATAWVASAGIIGIVVGFAARDTLANLISGVSIVADAPYKIGDYILLDTGERGLVTSLGIRSTRLLTRDDVEISIPNAVIGSAKIINESGGPWVRHRIRLPVGVAYDSDIDKVIAVLHGIATNNDTVADEPAPRVRIRGFGDSSINLELLCWIRRPEDRGRVVHDLALQVIRRFREEEIQIPFPQRDLHIRDTLRNSSGGDSAEPG